MSHDVQLQADVGSFSLQSLGAFSSILATLSADNVFPTALTQMENLGTLFPVNGEYAEKVKGLLQRCTDRRLDHFAFSIGWRKNDAASLMAGSAGGQAIALLSMCLVNLFGGSEAGLILSRLCSKLCPRSTNVSSVAQLVDVAILLSDKVVALGYGNLLAKEVTKIHDVYRALGRQSAPANLLEDFTLDSMIDLLEKVSHALCHENKICRISGHRGMGNIIGLIQALFPREVVIVVEGVIIQTVESPKIRCEVVDADKDDLTRVHLETSISTTFPIELPIEHINLSTISTRYPKRFDYLSFTWSNWLADCLRLTFMNYGLTCDRSVVEACCNLLVLIPALVRIKSPRAGLVSPLSLLALLGPLPQVRMCLICETILGCTPTERGDNLQTAFNNLLVTVTNASNKLACCCQGRGCDWSKGWISEKWDRGEGKRTCPRYGLWDALMHALHFGVWSFFLDVGPNVTVYPYPAELFPSKFVPSAIRQDYQIVKDPVNLFVAPNSLALHLQTLVTGLRSQHNLISSSGSCTVYPTVLQSMKLSPRQLVTFTVVEGRIVYGHRYHHSVTSATPPPRPRAEYSLMEQLSPSHIGVHSGSPLLTIRETYNSLELQMSIQYAGNEVKLNLDDVLEGYFHMKWTSPCIHPVTKTMDSGANSPLATSVASPAAEGKLGVAMTRWNPMAQFLCCEGGYQAILQIDCCLDCAMEQLGSDSEGVIIVG